MSKIIKRSALFLSLAVILFILLSLFSYYVHLLWRFYPKEPRFEAGLEWISEDGNIYVYTVERDNETEITDLCGYICVDGEKRNVIYNTRVGVFHAGRFLEECVIDCSLMADYKIDRKGNIILKNTEYFCDNGEVISLGKVVLKKITDSKN